MSDEKHGPDSVAYSVGPGPPYYQPFIGCLCGWSIRDVDWESVGRAFDEHLEALSDARRKKDEGK